MSIHGISSEDLRIIRDILQSINNVCFFGSRTKGTYRKFSDLDICLKDKISDYDYEILKEQFEESDLPFTVDLVQYDYVNDDFKKIIETQCIPAQKFLNLEQTMKSFTSKWNLTDIKKLKEQSPHTKNTIFSALKSNQPVILKHIQVPHEYRNEKECLTYFNGDGCVKLLDYDDQKQVLLLEKIEPGTKLSTLFPQEDLLATQIIAHLIKKLHQKAVEPSAFKSLPTIKSWLEKLNHFKGSQIPKDLLGQAQKLSHHLLQTQGKSYLLHGDLHHENILAKDEKWIAIDPKGVIGELAYECGAYLRNPIPDLLHQQNPQQILKKRVSIFSKKLDIPTERILQWNFVQAVLATIWALEDKSDNLDYWLRIAHLLKNTF